MNCELCGDEGNEAVCEACSNNLASGAVPVICITCRDRLGRKYGIAWMTEENINEDVGPVLEAMADLTGASPVMVRGSCSSCKKEEMPRCTSSHPASC